MKTKENSSHKIDATKFTIVNEQNKGNLVNN